MVGQPHSSPGVRIGCAGLPPGMRRQAYFTRLSFLETSETLGALPKTSVLRRWRREAAANGGFGIVVGDSDPQATSIVQANPSDIDAIAEAAATLRAEIVLFRTTPTLTPSSENRDRLAHFFTEVANDARFPDTTRVWQPHGLWEPEVAARFSADLGAIYACDPLSNDPLAPDLDFFATLPGNQAYFHVTGLGRPQQPLDEFQLDKLVALVSGYERAWVTFGNSSRLKDALALQRRLDAIN